MKIKHILLPSLIIFSLVNAYGEMNNPWSSEAVDSSEVKTQLAQVSSANNESVNFNNLSVNAFKALPIEQQKSLAKQWNMSSSNFQKYLDVRANSATGFRYGDVKQDPNILMALYELAEGEQGKAYEYMETAARNEHDAMEQLIEAQNMFQKMIQRLYPNETPIQLAGERPANYISYDNPFANLSKKYGSVISSNTTYVLVIDAHQMNMGLSAQVNGLIEELLKKRNVRLDIYDNSGSSNAQIIEWAKSMRINPAYINGGLVTLNQGGVFIPKLVARVKHPISSGTLYKDDRGRYALIKWDQVKV